MDNLKTDNDNDILGLFQESYNPIGLHSDSGFNMKDIIYKQTLVPLTPVGSTIIFKNKFYGSSTNFTLDKKELEIKQLNYGQNRRSSEHIQMYNKKPFDKDQYNKYLTHENLENLSGLEIEFVYEWEIGSILIFDRTNLHCSSSKIDGKKIGLTTLLKSNKMAIYDCFQYFNEDHIIDLRFNILDEFVDYFVISESTKTHQGETKN